MYLNITDPEVYTWTKEPSVTIELQTAEEAKLAADYFKELSIKTLTSGGDPKVAERELSRANMLYHMIDVFKKYETAEEEAEEGTEAVDED